MLFAQFATGPTHADRVSALRSDGSRVSWSFPTYRSSMPHDLIHLVVESGFGLRGGFWGRVDAGADPGQINRQTSLTANHFGGFGACQQQLLQAEGLAAVPWFDSSTDDADMCQSLTESCARFGAPPPVHAAPEQVAMVRAALQRLRGRWRRTAKGEWLQVCFEVDDPRAGLQQMLHD